jgi:phosphoglycolate phosphatase-like HAD superfamily hydrolase
VNSALEKIGGGPAVMVGDSVYDCEAAGNADVETIAVLTGGFSDSELLKSGARIVFASIVDLREGLSWTPLG